MLKSVLREASQNRKRRSLLRVVTGRRLLRFLKREKELNNRWFNFREVIKLGCKRCNKCKRIKLLSEFYYRKEKAPFSICIKCENRRRGYYQLKYPEKERERQRDWRAKNLEKYQKHKREYFQKRKKSLSPDKWRSMRRKAYYNQPLEARKAHDKINNSIRAGRFKRPPTCSKCNSKRPEAHHEDYSKPLDVLWLCRACHMRHHRNKNDELRKLGLL